MKFPRFGALAVAAAATFAAGSASAIPIDVIFNVAALGGFTANTGDVTNAATITPGAPNVAAAIVNNNVGLLPGQTITLSPVMGVNIGNMFTKTFSTAFGTFVESLTVISRTPGANSLGVLAVGTITQTIVLMGSPIFDPTPVFWSAAYTQNQGPGTQINGSFNNSTTPPTGLPEPGTLAMVGLALAGLSLLSKSKKA